MLKTQICVTRPLLCVNISGPQERQSYSHELKNRIYWVCAAWSICFELTTFHRLLRSHWFYSLIKRRTANELWYSVYIPMQTADINSNLSWVRDSGQCNCALLTSLEERVLTTNLSFKTDVTSLYMSLKNHWVFVGGKLSTVRNEASYNTLCVIKCSEISQNSLLFFGLKMGPIHCPETSVNNYHYTMLNLALCILYIGQAFRFSLKKAFYIFNHQIYSNIFFLDLLHNLNLFLYKMSYIS